RRPGKGGGRRSRPRKFRAASRRRAKTIGRRSEAKPSEGGPLHGLAHAHFYSSIPATQAVEKLASVPETMLRRPSSATSPRRSGASPPIPPIMIAREPKFAKPHSA